MKVEVEGKIVGVHFYKRVFKSEKGNKYLIETTCELSELIINRKRVIKTKKINSEYVRQNFKDSCDNVFARKMAFTKVICGLTRETRIIFWKTYKQHYRLVAGKKLRKIVKQVEVA